MPVATRAERRCRRPAAAVLGRQQQPQPLVRSALRAREALVRSAPRCRLTDYPDPETGAEHWTIGWGSTLDSQGPLLRSRLEDDGRLCCRFTYNCGHRFRLALVSVDGERASSPVYVGAPEKVNPGSASTKRGPA